MAWCRGNRITITFPQYNLGLCHWNVYARLRRQTQGQAQEGETTSRSRKADSHRASHNIVEEAKGTGAGDEEKAAEVEAVDADEAEGVGGASEGVHRRSERMAKQTEILHSPWKLRSYGTHAGK